MNHAPPAFLAGLPKGVLTPDPALVAKLVADLGPFMDALHAFHPFGTAQVTFGDHEAETPHHTPVSYRPHRVDSDSAHAQLAYAQRCRDAQNRFGPVDIAGRRFVDTILKTSHPLFPRDHIFRLELRNGHPFVVLTAHRNTYASGNFSTMAVFFASVLATLHATHLNGRSLAELRTLPEAAGYMMEQQKGFNAQVITCFGTDMADRLRCIKADQELANHVALTTPLMARR